MKKQPNLGMELKCQESSCYLVWHFCIIRQVEISKIIGKMYNGLSNQKKTKYLAIAEKHKEAYEGKMRKFMFVSRI
jgi:hypothetical protein